MSSRSRTQLILASAIAVAACVLPSSAAASTTPVTYRSGGTQTPGENDLLDHVSSAVRSTCKPFSADLEAKFTAGLVAAVNCSPSGNAAPSTVFYVKYADRASLDAAFGNAGGSGAPKGECTKGKVGQEDYVLSSKPDVTVGKLVCFTDRDEKYITWTHNELLILAQAQSSALTLPQLATWWSGNDSGPE